MSRIQAVRRPEIESYICPRCGHIFWVSIFDRMGSHLVRCPKCKKVFRDMRIF